MDMGSQPYALAREEGQALWFLGTLVIAKATGEQTGGAFGLLDNILPAGFASPYHMHRNEDEAFYVVEGELTFYVGEERVKAGSGAWVYGPRGVPHGFEVEGMAPARILLLNTPAGFEGVPRGSERTRQGADHTAGGATRHGETDGDCRQVRHRDPGAAARPLRSSG
jgi:mannose-6-phosphate isomerase-like protein (cupin superfamily)